MFEILGVPASGVTALGAHERVVLAEADVVVGSGRLLGGLDHLAADGCGVPDDRRTWPSPLLAGLDALVEELGDRSVAVLATGDPLVSGIGATLIRRLGPEYVRVHPGVSSVALARARMGWDAAECPWVSLVGRPLGLLTRYLTPGARVLCLSSDETTPGALAALLTQRGLGEARLTVLGDLGTDGESVVRASARELSAEVRELPRLNIVAVALPMVADGDDGPVSGRYALLGSVPGRPDDAFHTDGQLTKRDARAAAVTALRPTRGALLWDLGAGSGSVSVEWCLAAEGARAIAVERRADRLDLIRSNARDVAPGVTAVEGEVTSLPEGPAPDAVFIGGGGDAEVVAAAYDALRPGGRLVAHAVTLETETALVSAAQSFPDHGAHADLRRISVETAQHLGRFLAWQPARAVVQLTLTKPMTKPVIDPQETS